jgi:hypothetical protein
MKKSYTNINFGVLMSKMLIHLVLVVLLVGSNVDYKFWIDTEKSENKELKFESENEEESFGYGCLKKGKFSKKCPPPINEVFATGSLSYDFESSIVISCSPAENIVGYLTFPIQKPLPLYLLFMSLKFCD